MAFKDNPLEFFDNKIVDTHSGLEVMMDWEASIMEKSAEFICHNKGDILEIGFGMGICADYIQAQGVNSHTIVEIHPTIFEKLEVWSEGKTNVRIIQGDWASVNGLTYYLNEPYDGIFLDTFGDDSLSEFKTFALSKIQDGGRITYWNNNEYEYNPYSFESVSYEQISVSPDENSYTPIISNYYMPKVEV